MKPSSSRTVVVALVANIGVAIAKVAAAVLTASTAMTAEASHACADVGNQLLLVVAQRRSVRPADSRHPFGYGRDAYFWALLASVVVFVAGAVCVGSTSRTTFVETRWSRSFVSSIAR